jgi:hypothetical protein
LVQSLELLLTMDPYRCVWAPEVSNYVYVIYHSCQYWRGLPPVLAFLTGR